MDAQFTKGSGKSCQIVKLRGADGPGDSTGAAQGAKDKDGDTVAAAWMKGMPKERPCW